MQRSDYHVQRLPGHQWERHYEQAHQGKNGFLATDEDSQRQDMVHHSRIHVDNAQKGCRQQNDFRRRG